MQVPVLVRGMCCPITAIPGGSQDPPGSRGPALWVCRGEGPVANLPEWQLAL